MSKKNKHMGDCSVCGKALYEGDDAYATSAGKMDAVAEGFYMDTFTPWSTVACKECGSKISDAIRVMEESDGKAVMLSETECNTLSELLLEYADDQKHFKNGCPDKEDEKRIEGNIESANSLIKKLNVGG